MPVSTRRHSLEAELAELSAASRKVLIDRWQAAYGCLPPIGVRHDLLATSAAWHLQARRLGGLSRDGRRRLAREVTSIDVQRRSGAAHGREDEAEASDATGLVRELTGSVTVTTPLRERTPVLPGTRLIRDWNGTTHIVDVTDEGYLYAGRTYRSLSVIARTITGARWSGPRFFGL